MYRRGGDGNQRRKDDERFRQCIRAKFWLCWWIPKSVGSWIAQRYFKAVRILGSACFNYRAVPDPRFVKLVEAAKTVVATEHGDARLGSRELNVSSVVDRLLMQIMGAAVNSAEEALAEAGDQDETDTA